MFTWSEKVLAALGFKDAYLEMNWSKFSFWRVDRWEEGGCRFVDLGPVHLVYQA
ncbi:hypothetical protein ABID20_000272 [Rhizobium alvei]